LGTKVAAKLVSQVEASKAADLWRLIHGLGIRHVGERGAQALARAFGSLAALSEARLQALEAVPDVGPVVAASVRRFFDEPRTLALIDKLRAAGVGLGKMEASGATAGPGPFAGMTFVLTGTLPGMTRDEAQAAIEARGGKVSGSVSRKTTYVVVGEEAGSNLEKARELGVKTLDESAFRALAGL
jgi:DNA ligase (NAD+)